MNAKQSLSFDNHEQVVFINDEVSGLNAIIAIHNTNLGPAVGGCRMFPYASQAEALEDVLRLSRGMTYKSALAGLPMGGGKAVIIGDPAHDKSTALFAKMGEFIDSLNGKYITAEDSGISVGDLKIVATQTPHVLGINDSQEFGGDPSPLTAYGIFCGIQASIAHRFASKDLAAKRIAIQGVGAVGQYLAKLLLDQGAQVYACDINAANCEKARELGANIVGVDQIMQVQADVFAPCAMGAIINDQSIAQLGAPIVAGGANNQLALASHGELLRQRGVLYAPDFVINAGGIIEICRQLQDTSVDSCKQQIAKIGDTLSEIFTLSEQQQCASNIVAERLAERRFSRPNDSQISSAA